MNTRDDNLANTGPLNRSFFNWFLTNAAEIVSIGNANSTDQLNIVPLYLENVIVPKMSVFFKCCGCSCGMFFFSKVE